MDIKRKRQISTNITFRIPEESARNFKHFADQRGWVFSDMIRKALEEFTARQPAIKQTKFDFVK